ncbi:GntR family transcriptional regulator [Anaerocolumna xylanovorans]|uniref:Transcriptional regulator, GntR family n=1 Tax=Anaerocolumna xylanovorans DSM 12503 TaxID=1121345 RepID=A0A1M7XZQ3_9FIRM|nr:GntR family transcriptional regulator [Anaerocolumna xylanovorans]SHO44664.1 transcriptional regulator, GntR family [Anaerocolumna xylanovorans DSM 12503]
MKNKIDHNSPIPIHIQVESYLRELIEQDEYQEGKFLPNEVELSKKMGISRNTFRAAMDRLVLEGLIIRKKGVGSKVNKTKIKTTLTEWDSFSREMTTKGKLLKTISKEVQWVEADEEIAAALDVKPGTAICRLERIRGVDEDPVVIFISYFHPRVGVKSDEKFDGRLYEILQDKYYCIPEISDEEIGALPCSGYFSKKLNISADIPVLFRKRKVLNAADKILELCYAYYRSDKFLYTIRIKREDMQ